MKFEHEWRSKTFSELPVLRTSLIACKGRRTVYLDDLRRWKHLKLKEIGASVLCYLEFGIYDQVKKIEHLNKQVVVSECLKVFQRTVDYVIFERLRYINSFM